MSKETEVKKESSLCLAIMMGAVMVYALSGCSFQIRKDIKNPSDQVSSYNLSLFGIGEKVVPSTLEYEAVK